MPSPRILLGLGLLALVNGSAVAADPKPIRALLVTGGCCHDYSAQKEIISKGLADRARIEFTVVQQGGDATDSRIPLYDRADWAKDFDVVLHDECFADVKDPAYTRRITDPHKAGLPAVVIHCAMHCYRDGTDEWFKFCGVTSWKHGAAYPHEVLNRDPKHPIMSRFGPAWGNPAGELYWIDKVWPTAHPLASSKNQETGKDEVCVWTNDYGKGRVFGTTLGHHNQTVSSGPYLDLLTRGTLWACGKLDDTYLKPVVSKVVAIDEAKGKPATASTVQGGNDVKNANDGNPESRWCASSDSIPQWWMVDLGAPTKVTGVRVDWESEGSAYRHKIEGSADGKSFRTLVDASENAKAGPSVSSTLADTARYVRVTFLGTSPGGWGSIREVQVFGDRTRVDGPSTTAARPLPPGDLKVPAGFEATLFAAPPALNYPVYVAASPGGDVYVSSDKNGSLDRKPHRGSVYRLRDVDGDGVADESRHFVPDVDSPRGLVWDKDRLYLMHPPHLSAFIDKDGDGSADEEKILVKNIAFGFKDRPADHTSNGVTLGIDGWLYLAIGDFGFMEAEGTDGRKLQLRGGGVVRVRPDGTGLEVFSRGTRNILEVGIDPLLNMFSRDNTNDGGGWDIRLHHFSGMEHHGYPSLFQHFGEEIIAPLADYGGGSGCGGLYLSEPGFPDGYGDAMYTADWGRERIFRHKMTPKGATFSADQTEFLSSPRVTDLDVDASSRLYVSSWKNAVFTYNGEDVGYVARVVPKGYTPEPLPDFAKLNEKELIQLLESPSHRRRLEAQRELFRRNDNSTLLALFTFADDKSKPIAGRVAAIFALKEMWSPMAPFLVKLTEDPSIREYAIYALTDRLDQMDGVPSATIVSAMKDENPRVRLQAAIAAARLGKLENAMAVTTLLADPDPIVAHTAVRSLASLKAADACFAVVDRSDAPIPARTGALRALSYVHDLSVVDGLIRRLDAESDPARRAGLVTALCRLDHREGPWKGDSWGTRPDTSGPYYQAEDWEATARIEAALKADLSREKGDGLAHLIREFGRNKIKVSGGLDAVVAQAEKDPTFVPAAVNQLAQADAIPGSAIPLLLKAATGDGTPATRSQAIVGLLKAGGEQAAKVVPAALASLEKAGGDRRDFQKARDAYLNAPKLGDFVAILDDQAKALDGGPSAWSDAGLLALSALNSASPEAREHASKAIEAGSADPKRRVQILRAIVASGQRRFSEKILTALADPDASVATAAKEAASTMKIANRPRPSGPKIESLKTEEVLDLAFKTKGDASLGEQLFTKQNCVNCHTIRQSDPQRGPYLGNIATTYKRRELAEAILMPSKTIAQGFVTNAFALDDGRTLVGFVVQEAADSVTIRDAKGEEIKIPTSKIEDRAKQTASIMPEGLVAPLTVHEFASLLDYLESLARAK